MARTPFKLKSGNTSTFKQMGSSSPAKDRPDILAYPDSAGAHEHPHPGGHADAFDETGKRIISVTDEQTLLDMAILKKSADPTKFGGKGLRTKEEQILAEKAKKRLATQGSYKLTRGELLKLHEKHQSNLPGKYSKLKNLFKSTKRLRTELYATGKIGAKSVGGFEGQVVNPEDWGGRENVDVFSGVTKE